MNIPIVFNIPGPWDELTAKLEQNKNTVVIQSSEESNKDSFSTIQILLNERHCLID